MKQSEALDMITKIQLAHQAMESAWKRVDELKEENKNLKEALAKQEQDEKRKLLPRCFADYQPNHTHDRKCEWCAVNTECQTGEQPKQEQGEPVAYIHRNEYNEYRLEPHDNFDIKSIPFNVDVPLFKEKNT